MTAPKTLAEMFLDASRNHPKPARFLQRTGAGKPYAPISTDEFFRDVQRCARALRACGVAAGDRVGLLSYNRVEWAQVDYASQLLGAPTVPLYSTLPADQAAYILRDSGAKIVFVEDEAQASKIREVRSSLPDLEHVVAMSAVRGVESLGDFLARGGGDVDPQVGEDDLATLIYTSGTTGVPKGVMLTQRNLVSNLLACCEVLTFTREDVGLSFLPVSHIFERIVDYALYHIGATIAYCETGDTVGDDLREVRPTVMAAVPRFYEKVHGRIREALSQTRGMRRRLARRAIEVGGRAAEYLKRGEPLPFPLSLRFAIARALVLKKFHERTGGRIRIFVSGGAPLSREVGDFFWSLGFTVLEGYGLTETSPVITVNRPGRVRVGTVGEVIPGVEVRIAEDGEILCRGPNVMRGYFRKPEESAEVLRDGWFHTGDIGELEDGFLRITDRKKDLLKTSGGKYIAPQPIENRLKQRPLIGNAVVVGDRRKFPAVLLVPNFEDLRSRFGQEPASALVARPEVHALYQGEVDEVNRDLAQYEKLKKFALLPEDFTIDGGDLTPTMKVKRKRVQEKYASVIEELYRE